MENYLLNLKLDRTRTRGDGTIITPDSNTDQRHATVNGAVPLADDLFGACLYFNGKKGSNGAGDNLAIDPKVFYKKNDTIGPFTVEVWIKTTAEQGTIASFDRGQFWALSIGNQPKTSAAKRKVMFNVKVNKKLWKLQSKSEISDGEWHHIAASYDKTTARIFIDGVEEASKTADPDVEVTSERRFGFIGVNSTNAGAGQNYFKGAMSGFRITPSALTLADFQLRAQKKVIPSFIASHPIDFYFLDEGDEKRMLLTNEKKGQTMKLEIRNESGKNVMLNADVAHFELTFRPGALFRYDEITLDETNSADWEMTAPQVNPDKTIKIIFKKVVNDLSLQPGEKTVIKLNTVRANSSGGSRASQVSLKYRGLNYENEIPELKGTRVDNFNIISHMGKERIPLQVAFVGPNSIINDGVTLNELTVRIMNTSKKEDEIISFIHDANNKDRTSAFTFSFNSGIDNDIWALGSADHLLAVKFSEIRKWVNSGKTEDGQGHWETTSHSLKDEAKVAKNGVWQLTLNETDELKPGDFYQFSINDIKSNKNAGLSNLFIHYEDLPGYWDGDLILPIDKGPLVFRKKPMALSTDVAFEMSWGKSFSCCFWAKIGNSGSSYPVLSISSIRDDEYMQDHSTKVQINFYKDTVTFLCGGPPWAPDQMTVDLSSNQRDNDWHHWAFVYGISDKNMLIYRDGKILKQELKTGQGPTHSYIKCLGKSDSHRFGQYQYLSGIMSSELINTIYNQEKNEIWNAGIGTDEPRSKLHVAVPIGDAELSITTEARKNKARISLSTISPLYLIREVGGFLEFDGKDDKIQIGHSRTTSKTKSITHGDYDLQIETEIIEQSPSITILYGGNVGIGTDEPYSKLHVDGTIKASELDGGSGRISGGSLHLDLGQINCGNIIGRKLDVRGGPIIGGVITGSKLDVKTGPIKGGAITGNELDVKGGPIIGGVITGSKLDVKTGPIIGGVITGSKLDVKTGPIKGGAITGSELDVKGGPIKGGAGNFSGRVGIGVPNPTKAKLEIEGWGEGQEYDGGRYTESGKGETYSHSKKDLYFALWAKGYISAQAFYAHSDQRVKKISGRSERISDLLTLKKLEITDYTYVDQLQKGSGKYKKIVAQQVRKVFPQAVTLSTDEIPDIYKLANIKNGWVSLYTDLRVGEKVQLIYASEKKLFDVLEINENGFRVDSEMEGEVFVYGRQVDDFHNVDYDAISMLNVSATQELARQVERLQAENREQATRILELENKVQNLESMNTRIARIEAAMNGKLSSKIKNNIH